ncbi:MAG: halocyanin domain protein [Halorubrum sp. J07HR59]|nr:MAG: halocyanin domain protein [Halorubrum sp. J07HR59]
MGMNRRDFIRGAGGATAAVAAGSAASAPATAQEEARPDFSGWLDSVDGGYKDHRGEDEVRVSVGASGNGGNFAFSPAGIWIDEGTTVIWEWTGEAGAHNVKTYGEAPLDNVHELDSGSSAAGSDITYEHTFDGGGLTGYFCKPHEGLSMFGAVAVGEDIAVIEPSPNTGWPEDIAHSGVELHPHWHGMIAGLGIVASFVFTFYVVKYGASAHTGTGRDS